MYEGLSLYLRCDVESAEEDLSSGERWHCCLCVRFWRAHEWFGCCSKHFTENLFPLPTFPWSHRQVLLPNQHSSLLLPLATADSAAGEQNPRFFHYKLEVIPYTRQNEKNQYYQLHYPPGDAVQPSKWWSKQNRNAPERGFVMTRG